MTGRPSDFTQEIANAICEALADGKSLRKICEDDDMPDRTTVRRWLANPNHAEFRLQYAHAREEQADVYAERIVDEAETATDASLGRLRMDALKWAASKLAPKRYGDKLALGGDDDLGPIRHTVEWLPSE
jgi:hypothetical protein